MRFYAKAVAAMVPGASKLPWVPGSGDTLPDVELEREVRVDRVHLAKYAHLCGYDLRDALPPTYPHVLAFPLHEELMGDGRFLSVEAKTRLKCVFALHQILAQVGKKSGRRLGRKGVPLEIAAQIRIEPVAPDDAFDRAQKGRPLEIGKRAVGPRKELRPVGFVLEQARGHRR